VYEKESYIFGAKKFIPTRAKPEVVALADKDT
jgi:hypothetical protein